MSIKSAEEFLKKVGNKKKISKFAKHKEDIVYLYNQGATLEIITQYLETKGLERKVGYNALSSFIKRNLSKEILEKKAVTVGVVVQALEVEQPQQQEVELKPWEMDFEADLDEAREMAQKAMGFKK